MYEIEAYISKKMLSIDKNIDIELLQEVDGRNACAIYAFEKIEKNPDILTVNQINSINEQGKYELLICNVGIQLIKEHELDRFLLGVNKALIKGGRFIFNSLYVNEEKETDSNKMKDILIENSRKNGVKEISKYMNFIIRPFYSLTFWGYTFNKFNLKLKNYNKFQLTTDMEELTSFYMNTYNNNILTSDMIELWREIISDCLYKWQSINSKELFKWNFMPGTVQDWYTLEFVKFGDS